MKRILFFLSIVTSTASQVVAQTNSKAYDLMLKALYKETVPTITVPELKKKPDAVLLDTRAKAEYDVSHLPGARWVGYDDFDLSRVRGVPKDADIVVYCSVGYRSEKVGEKLQAAGYQHVQNLYGSLFEWVNQGNPVVDSSGKSTQRVHAFSRPWGIWLQRGEKVYE